MMALSVPAALGSLMLSLAVSSSERATLLTYKETPPNPEFILIVQDPDSVGTPRHWNRPPGRTRADVLRVEISQEPAVLRWKELLTPVLDGRPHERPIQPWIFGFFGQGEDKHYFESDGCVVYSKELGRTGKLNVGVLPWIRSQVEVGDFTQLCLEPPDRAE